VVTADGKVMYAGQAIIVASCASGTCHTSTAKGDARRGAPEGLDFDIAPATFSATTVDKEGNTVGNVDKADLDRLAKYQRKVFDERDHIWEQVDRGLMPPDGPLGQPSRDAPQGALFVTYDADTCTRGAALNPIKSGSAKAELKEWLACGTPVVEASGPGLPQEVAGTVGRQFPECGGGPTAPTFEAVYSTILVPTCAVCHPTLNAPDFSSIEKSYESLLGAGGKGVPSGCSTNDAPYVTPGDVSKSYIVAKVGGGGAFCGPVMPESPTPLSTEQLDLLKAWIDAGAPAPGQSAGDAGVAGGDAGAGDAGQ
jgi:hypothetical protein